MRERNARTPTQREAQRTQTEERRTPWTEKRSGRKPKSTRAPTERETGPQGPLAIPSLPGHQAAAGQPPGPPPGRRRGHRRAAAGQCNRHAVQPPRRLAAARSLPLFSLPSLLSLPVPFSRAFLFFPPARAPSAMGAFARAPPSPPSSPLPLPSPPSSSLSLPSPPSSSLPLPSLSLFLPSSFFRPPFPPLPTLSAPLSSSPRRLVFPSSPFLFPAPLSAHRFGFPAFGQRALIESAPECTWRDASRGGEGGEEMGETGEK